MPQANSGGVGLRILALVMGVFLCLMGVNKLSSITDSNGLVSQLLQWRDI